MRKIITYTIAATALFANIASAATCTTREDAPVARNKSDFFQMVRYEEAGNTRAITKMADVGQLFVAPGGQSVQRISVEGRLAKIAVSGNSGWTFNSFLICR